MQTLYNNHNRITRYSSVLFVCLILIVFHTQTCGSRLEKFLAQPARIFQEQLSENQSKPINFDCLSETKATDLTEFNTINRLLTNRHTSLAKRQNIHQILAIVIAIVLFPYFILQAIFYVWVLRRITYWKIITYIHKLDGKKRAAYSP